MLNMVCNYEGNTKKKNRQVTHDHIHSHLQTKNPAVLLLKKKLVNFPLPKFPCKKFHSKTKSCPSTLFCTHLFSNKKSVDVACVFASARASVRDCVKLR